MIEGWSQLDDPNLPDLTVDQLIDFLVDENIQQFFIEHVGYIK